MGRVEELQKRKREQLAAAGRKSTSASSAPALSSGTSMGRVEQLFEKKGLPVPQFKTGTRADTSGKARARFDLSGEAWTRATPSQTKVPTRTDTSGKARASSGVSGEAWTRATPSQTQVPKEREKAYTERLVKGYQDLADRAANDAHAWKTRYEQEFAHGWVSDDIKKRTSKSPYKSAAEAEEAASAYNKKKEDLLAQYYVKQSQEKLDTVSKDKNASQALRNAQGLVGLRTELQKYYDVAATLGQDQSDARTRKQAMKYGLTEAECKDIWTLFDAINKKLKQAKDTVEKTGVSYDDVYDYTFRQKAHQAAADEKAALEAELDDNAGAMARHSLKSVPASLAKGVDYAAVIMNNWGHNDETDLDAYRPMNPDIMTATNYTSTVRGKVGEEIQERAESGLKNLGVSDKAAHFGGQAGKFLYDTGMSIADNATLMATLGAAGAGYAGTGALISGVMGSSAAADQMKHILDSGGSNSQAIAGGLASGVAEALFEKVSIDALLKPKNITSFKGWAKEVLKQGGVEASEEVCTELANMLTDAMIRGQDSDFQRSVAYYQTEEGGSLSYEKAREKAYLDAVGQVALAGLGGFISGGVMSGAKGSLDLARNHAGVRANAAIDRAYDTMREKGMFSPEARQAAQKALDKTASRSRYFGVDAPEKRQYNEGKVSPAASEEVQRAEAQSRVTQAANPESNVLDAAATLFTQQGMKLKTAQEKAGIVQRLINGEEVSNRDINKLNPTSRESQAIFTQLTGVQFPAGKLSMEQLYNLYRSAHSVAVQAQEARDAQEHTRNGTETAQDPLVRDSQRFAEEQEGQAWEEQEQEEQAELDRTGAETEQSETDQKAWEERVIQEWEDRQRALFDVDPWEGVTDREQKIRVILDFERMLEQARTRQQARVQQQAQAEQAAQAQAEQETAAADQLSEEDTQTRAPEGPPAANPENDAKAKQLLARLTGDVAPDGNPLHSFKDFSEACRARYPKATREEIARMYDQYRKDNQTIAYRGGRISHWQFMEMVRNAPSGSQLTESEAESLWQREVERQRSVDYDEEADNGQRSGADQVHRSGLSRQSDQRPGEYGRGLPESAGQAEGEGSPGREYGDRSGEAGPDLRGLRTVSEEGQVNNDTPVHSATAADGRTVFSEVSESDLSEPMKRQQEKLARVGIRLRGAKGRISIPGTNRSCNGMSILGVESIVQTDSPYFTDDQLCDHEAGHQYFFLDGTTQHTDLYNRCKTAYEKATTPEQRKQLLGDYLAKYKDIYDGADTETRQDALYNQVIEEILCDAYAGMNRDGAGADQFQSAVKPIIDEWFDQRDAENRTRTEASRNSKNDAREDGGTRYSPEDARYAYAGKSLTDDSSVYSYEFLTSLPDMQVTSLPEVDAVRDSSGKVDARTVVDLGMKNARAVGTERDGKVFVQNRYTGKLIQVTGESIRHGLNGKLNRILTNSRLGAVIGDLTQNAVPINSLHNKAMGVTGTYAMAGFAVDNAGREFVAILTVEQREGRVIDFESYDLLHATSGRQKNSSQASTKLQGLYPIKAADITIADAREDVNSAPPRRQKNSRQVSTKLQDVSPIKAADATIADTREDVNGTLPKRQRRSERVDTKSQGVYPSTNASKITIADFLETVKSTHQSILSEDVLAHFGETRNAKGDYAGKAKFSLEETAADQENEINQLRAEQRELEERLDAPLTDMSEAEERQIRNRLVKVDHEISKLVAKERAASVRTTLPEILENLPNYRRSDLESLAEQVSDSAWDDYEDMSRSDLEDALREILQSRMDDLSPLEQQSKKFGLYVRPAAAKAEAKTRYSLTPEFEQWYKENFDGEDLTDEQLQRRLDYAKRKESEVLESRQAAKSKQDADQRNKDLTAWMMYHEKTMRAQRQTLKDRSKAVQQSQRARYEGKLQQQDEIHRAELAVARDEKVKALKDKDLAWQIYSKQKSRQAAADKKAALKDARQKANAEKAEAVQTTKDVERAKAEERIDEMQRKAAERLKVQKDAYEQKDAKRKENQKKNQQLKRNAARQALRDAKSVARKRAAIETEQGMVNTLRKNPAERTAIEKLQAAASQLRTLGRSAYRAFVNQAMDIDNLARRQISSTRASTLVTVLGGASSTVSTIYKEGLVDREGNRIGDSMQDVFLCWDHKHKKVDQAKQALLQDYLLHAHNVDRMSFVDRARTRLEAFEKSNPDLAKMDTKEFARLVALTDAEIKETGQQEAHDAAVRYARLLHEYDTAQNKPIFGDSNGNAVTADTSRAIVQQYLEENPWLEEKSQEIYEWWDKFMRAWAVGDSITETEYDTMRVLYPHYVPTYRADKKGVGAANFVGANGASIGTAVKRAKGGMSEVVNVEDSFSNLVNKIVRLARTNELYMNMIDSAMLDNDGVFEDMIAFDWDWQSGQYGDAMRIGAILNGDLDARYDDDTAAGLSKVGQDRKLTAWHDGRKYSAYVSEDLFKSIANVTGTVTNDFERGLITLGNVITGPMKTAITGINPAFAIRNVTRDFPTAVTNSISGMAFGKYYLRAAAEIAKNSENWQRFQALGGTNSTFYNDNKGFVKIAERRDGPVKKTKDTLGAFNEVTEAQTRFAEYLATVDRLGDTYENRLLGIKNAAEVTVDFSRKGRFGKAINAWVPYWNPSVQGVDKVIRSVIDSPDGSAVWKQAAKTVARASMGTVLMEAVLYAVLKALGRYDDWEELDDRTKDTYYCIPYGEEHKYIKIPKNREWGAILGTPLMRILEHANGRENPFENYIETSLTPNFLPGMILAPREGGGWQSDMIGFSQALDLQANKDFAGRTIVPYDLQQGSPEMQYDENTGFFAKQLGKMLKFSPIQIDYLVKDYFGDFGDILVTATSKIKWDDEKSVSENVLENARNIPKNVLDIWNGALDILSSPFKADSQYSNYSVSKYYDTIEQLERVVQDRKNQLGSDAYKDTVEHKTKSAMDKLYGKQISELNRQIRESTSEDERDSMKGQIVDLVKQALDYYQDCIDGKIENPVLDAQYTDKPDAVSKELIRLDSYAEDYRFKPSGSPSAKYTDPKNKNKEYVLTDPQKKKFKEIYDEQYSDIFERVIQSSKYRSASDEKKAGLLEDARDDVLEETKDEFFEWLAKNSESTPKKKKKK